MAAPQYDVIIIGGGLAGLSLSIQLAGKGYKIALFEKEKYPFHKVCGEYISLESWDFIRSLGIPLENWKLPIIKKLLVSAPGGQTIESALPLGGFGVSRYKLDAALALVARASGVSIYEETKVNGLRFADDQFRVEISGADFTARLVCASYGKRTNLDVKWKRSFLSKRYRGLHNYIGVKYHVNADFPEDMIALHNFEQGYCGISRIEDGRYCLCYLTTAENLRRSNNSIPLMEKNILQKNPFLAKIFSNSTHYYAQPLTISQISFSKKSLVEDHILFLGDAAGMITPLCGNGMSMALHSSRIASICIADYLDKKTDRPSMEKSYAAQWNRQFSSRLKAGRLIQRFFGNARVTDILLRTLKPFPKLISKIIQQTHGKAF